jgi:general secretion pathway protein G
MKGMTMRIQTNSNKADNSGRGSRAGFTLIEMLVVLAILVLLMSMVGPRILGSRKKADISAAKTQIGMLTSSLESYAVDMKEFPSTEQGLKALVDQPTDKGKDKETKWDGPYISKAPIPKDPWGHEYQYQFPPKHGKDKSPDVWSLGPDGEDNTEDDIVSWSKEDDKGSSGGTKRTASAN